MDIKMITMVKVVTGFHLKLGLEVKKILSNYSRYQFHSLYHRMFLPYIFRWKRGDYDEVITQNNVEFSDECYKLFLTERHLSSITTRHLLTPVRNLLKMRKGLLSSMLLAN